MGETTCTMAQASTRTPREPPEGIPDELKFRRCRASLNLLKRPADKSGKDNSPDSKRLRTSHDEQLHTPMLHISPQCQKFLAKLEKERADSPSPSPPPSPLEGEEDNLPLMRTDNNQFDGRDGGTFKRSRSSP